MNTPRTWRVAVIDWYRNKSKGSHGIHEAFLGLPGVEICGAADPDEQSRISLARDVGTEHIYADWQELIDKEKPDILVQCSRVPTAHPEPIIGAAEAGIHVYCEKPFAVTLEEADRMIEAAEKTGVKITVAHLARFWESFHTARSLIQSGELGRPLMAYCRGKEDERGGGEDMIVLGTHLFDIARFLFGDPSWVFSHISENGRDMVKEDAREPSEPVGPVAGDEITATFGFPDNIHCLFESRKDMFDGEEWRFGITIVCEKAKLSFRYSGDKRVLRICRTSSPFEESSEFTEADEIPIPEIPGATPIPAEKLAGPWAYYLPCNRRAAWDLICAIQEDREPVSSGKDARWALEMIHGVYASHLGGNRQTFPLSDRTHPLE